MNDYVIYKYPLIPGAARDEHGNAVIDVEMPRAHTILKADRQGDSICVWAGVRDGDPLVTQRFVVVPTGSQYNQWALMHIDTVFMGALVFHVFKSQVTFS